jgi:peroxiredoxin
MRFILIYILLLFALISSSQIYAPDFTMTDTDGNTYNLHNECSQGKTVVLDFFYRNCGTCQINTPKVDSIWHNNGANGVEVWVWGIEGVVGVPGATNAEVDSFKIQYGATFPCFSTDFNDDTILYDYDILYNPKYFVVCPDTRMKPTSVDYLQYYIDICLAVSSNKLNSAINADIVSVSTLKNTIRIYFKRGNYRNVSFDVFSISGQKIISLTDIYYNEYIDINKNSLGKGIFYIQMSADGVISDREKLIIL